MDHTDFSISKHFSNINDPRKYHIRHNLIDIIAICGAENWADVEQYGI
ncbi:MAG: transposase family protein [Alphaproteobacteria bacterium]|nr:transposase family protein [Alphaproteobacteria bacterium]